MRTLLRSGLSCLGILIGTAFVQASTFLVTNNAQSGPGSLSAAISAANADPLSPHEIHFNLAPDSLNLPMPSPSSLQRPTTIDGRTQPGYAGVPLVKIIGGPGFQAIGLTSNCHAKALWIKGNSNFFQPSITVSGTGSTVTGTYISNDGSVFGGMGVSVSSGTGHRIGGPGLERNIFSSKDPGIQVGVNATGNVIAGNTFGKVAGVGLPAGRGVLVLGNNTIIGDAVNDVSNNFVETSDPVVIQANNCKVQNNYVNLDENGDYISVNTVSGGLSFARVAPPTTGTATGNVVGGLGENEANYVGNWDTDGIWMSGSGNTAIGNYMGYDAHGNEVPVVGNNARGIRLAGTANVADSNRIRRGVFGITTDSGSSGHLIVRNVITGSATGMNLGGSDQSIGTSDPLSGNEIISCPRALLYFTSGNKFLNNRFNIRADGSLLPPAGTTLWGSLNQTNLIRNNLHGDENPVASQTGGAITWQRFGEHTPNDNLDADTGMQNHPVINSALETPAGLEVKGTLHSTPNTEFQIDIYSGVSKRGTTAFTNPRAMIGTLNVTTDAAGNATFTMPNAVLVTGHAYVCATATGVVSQGTSNYSHAWKIGPVNVPPVADAGADQSVTVPHDGSPATNTASISLNASASSDPDNDTLSFQWLENGTPIGTGSVLTINRTPGTRTYTVNVSDGSGNTSSDTCVVQVKPEVNLPPTVFAGNDATYEATGAMHAVVLSGQGTDGDVPPDNLSYRWTLNGQQISTQQTFTYQMAVETLTFTVTATDPYGASAASKVTVSVRDTTGPTVTLNGGAAMTIPAGTPFVDPGASASDLVDGTVPVSVSGTVAPQPGVYTVTYQAVDRRGNMGTASRVVSVVDLTAPVISVNGDNPVTIACHSTYEDAGAWAMDDYDGPVSVSVSGTVDTSEPGTYFLTYMAIDSSGNIATETREVRVVDVMPPIVVLNGQNPMDVQLGGTFDDPGVTAHDDCSDVTVVTNGTVDINTPGTYTITYIATDESGNSATASRQVRVRDLVPPEISSVSVTPTLLKQNNHKMVLITVSYAVGDNSGDDVEKWITVTSNEPDNGLGDGDTAGDISIVDAHNVYVRAERSGTGSGRVYTITIHARDRYGNLATTTATVTVPR